MVNPAIIVMSQVLIVSISERHLGMALVAIQKSLRHIAELFHLKANKPVPRFILCGTPTRQKGRAIVPRAASLHQNQLTQKLFDKGLFFGHLRRGFSAREGIVFNGSVQPCAVLGGEALPG